MGSNLNGRLGVGDKCLEKSATPCLVKSLRYVNNVSCGWTHTAAITGLSSLIG